ncbi:hypothetical protein GPALN_010699 [Globodera pallida]|nr:hypothetical protein GPALN_010699 [Globodera pallida]
MSRSVDKWMCCCGCHVTEGAYKMAWIFTILNILVGLITALVFISTGLNAKLIFYAVNVLVSLLCWLPILCGHICGKRSHRMYLPSLFLFAISTVYTFFEILYLVLQRILMFKSPDPIYVMFGLSLKEYEQLVGYSTGEVAFFILLMIAFLACWVYSIVFRAYKFTKQIDGDGISDETKMPI